MVLLRCMSKGGKWGVEEGEGRRGKEVKRVKRVKRVKERERERERERAARDSELGPSVDSAQEGDLFSITVNCALALHRHRHSFFSYPQPTGPRDIPLACPPASPVSMPDASILLTAPSHRPEFVCS